MRLYVPKLLTLPFCGVLVIAEMRAHVTVVDC